MAEKKMTRKEALELAIRMFKEHEYGANENFMTELEGIPAVEVLTKMYEQISKPRKKSNTPSKARLANENMLRKCVEAMKGHDKVTSAWLLEHVTGWTSLTPQKVTAVMNIGIEDGTVIRTKEGKAVYYSVVE